MKKIISLMALLGLLVGHLQAQDTATYRLRLSLSLLDVPQYNDLPHHYPTMQQSMELSNNLYDLGYLGIDALGNTLVKTDAASSGGKRALNKTVKYLLSLGFVKYGSELPVPLGVWAHEEFHRAVLGVNGIASKNGNWLPSRWDGTVYGVSDEELAALKQRDVNGLLYAYVAGVQSENLSTQQNLLSDFYHQRASYKNALYLYNAYYTWDYLKFSTSPASDRIKADAGDFEAADPRERDFAGSDMTAWTYDMFNPKEPYSSRDQLPGEMGVNRRVGFSDLSAEAQDFLVKQKKLSLFNFLNPAIFFVNRIRLSDNFSFNFFGQYVPTHFGNDIALQVPVQYGQYNLLLGLHSYHNRSHTFPGLELGLLDQPLGRSQRWQASVLLHGWMQPESQQFYASEGTAGGAADLQLTYRISRHFATFAHVSGKTAGWRLASPYLNSNASFRLGLNYVLAAD